MPAGSSVASGTQHWIECIIASRVPGSASTRSAGRKPANQGGPRRLSISRHAVLGGQFPVAEQPLEPRALEQHRPVELGGRVQRQPRGCRRQRTAARRAGQRSSVAQRRAEVVGLEAGVAAADHRLDRVRVVGQDRDPDGGRAVDRDHDRPQELHVVQHRRAGAAGQRARPPASSPPCPAPPGTAGRRRAGGRRGRGRRGGQVGVDDQLDAGVVHLRPVQEAQQRQLALLQGDRRQTLGPAHDHQRRSGPAGRRASGTARRRRLRSGSGRCPRASATPARRAARPCPAPGPDRPFQRQAPAVRVVARRPGRSGRSSSRWPWRSRPRRAGRPGR